MNIINFIRQFFFVIGVVFSMVFIALTPVFAQVILNDSDLSVSNKSIELSNYQIERSKELLPISVSPVVIRDVIINKIILSDGVICYKYINSISCIKN